MRWETLTAAFGLLVQTVSAAPVSDEAFTQLDTFAKRDVATTLGSKLSHDATIILPSNPEWTADTARWTQYLSPSFSVIVEPATEADIAASVRYATQNNMTFLAVSGLHGYNPSLATVQNALMINLATHFNYTVIDAHTGTATVGGGINIGQLVNATFSAGRQLTVGSCWCVGVIGAGLGGGHGRLQGEHGLIIDAMNSLRVVLADGSIITVSATQNADLFWGLRGAGQNFGIVIDANLTTQPLVDGGTNYDVEMDFSTDKIEIVLELMNTQIDQLIPALAVDIIFGANPTTLEPIFHINFVYSGPRSEGRKYSQPWKDLGPINFVENDYTWRDLPYLSAQGLLAAQCSKNEYKNTYSLNLKHFNTTTMRQVFTSWSTFLAANPNINKTIVLFEVYGQPGVRAYPNDSTAFPGRYVTNILAVVSTWYTNPALNKAVDTWAQQTREVMVPTSGYRKLHVYQNYAHSESLQAYYGYEPWRLDRLEDLKAKYDPTGRFNGYAPIPIDGRGW